jgi:DNA-binding response OmpR family regulator
MSVFLNRHRQDGPGFKNRVDVSAACRGSRNQIFSGASMIENRKKKILLVEDDGEMRSFLMEWMEEEGYDVDCAENGAEACQKAGRETFDLIITDVRMPGPSGLDILPGLRKLQPDASVIVITAFGSLDVRSKAFKRGADGYLEKPLRLQDLRTLVNEMVYLHHPA